MTEIFRYLFAILGMACLMGLVAMDKIYPTQQPVPGTAYYIVGVAVIGVLVGSENLTLLIKSFINKYTGKKDDSTSGA